MMTTQIKSRIHRDDEVLVIAGRDKGARGKVIRVISSDNRVLVSKVNMVKRHTRQTQQTSGGIIEKRSANRAFECAIFLPEM